MIGLRKRILQSESHPSITVCMTAYNEEAVIANTINDCITVLNQIPGHHEILVVNDGSNDRTGQILQELEKKHSRLRVLVHPGNRGIAKAQRWLIQEAKGELIFHLASDGEWKAALEVAVAPHRRGNGGPYCLVGLSGGRDSSYSLHYVKNVLKMNPVTYTYDWGMVTDLARRNIARMCGALGVEHILVSANIPRKRRYIQKNVTAWLRRPELGIVPLFMAGDKPWLYHARKVSRQIGVDLVIMGTNISLENTDFKTGFCGVGPID